MCGRAAQTYRAVRMAAQSLGVVENQQQQQQQQQSTTQQTYNKQVASDNPTAAFANDGKGSAAVAGTTTERTEYPFYRDNFNMSPGMDAIVFYRNDGELQMDRKVWGLVTKRGFESSPIPPGMQKHFANLMFNARSDTLYQKPTFGRLATAGKTCVIAVEGFFEWKSVVLGGKGKKQPYFIYRKNDLQQEGSTFIENNDSTSSSSSYLLMAGLWTSVPTGRPDDPVLDTFSMITQESCPSFRWLHHRMPVCIWDNEMARAWLERPSEQVLQQLEQVNLTRDSLQWHAVTPDMSSAKFRSADAIKALPPQKTVKSFFSAVPATPPKPAAAKVIEHLPTIRTEGNLSQVPRDVVAENSNNKNSKTNDETDARKGSNLKRHASPPPKVVAKKPKLSATPNKSKPKEGCILNYFAPKPKSK